MIKPSDRLASHVSSADTVDFLTGAAPASFDSAGFLLLGTALEALDRIGEAQKTLAAEGIIICDRWGQEKPHPATVIERDSRAGLLAALRALKFDPEEFAK